MGFNPVQTFLLEAEELLANIEQSALTLGDEEAPAETVNQLFRAFHTIKGSGAMCGLHAVAGFTHHVETLLDKVRDGAVPVPPGLAHLLLAAADQIKKLLVAGQGGKPVGPESSQDLISKIEEFAGARPSRIESPTVPAAAGMQHGDEAEGHTWKVTFRPSPGLLTCGGNPVLLLAELKRLGPCEIEGHTEDVPPLDEIQPDLCYLWWSITLRSSADENSIRDVFIFADDGTNLEVERLQNEPQPPDDRTVSVKAPTDAASQPAPLGLQKSGGEVIRKALVSESTVRVPSNRLDRLVNLVGELVLNQSRLAQAAAQSGGSEFTHPVQELERLVAELRDNVLGIRMLPIGTIFGRFRRLVHDLSAELGKEVDLVAEGSETELDKSILDQLSEPLVHCLRNCLDHGIEPPAERTAKGKPLRATIRLSALHMGSAVVVGIHDDGRGIDRAAVRARALEKGLIAPDAILSDKDIFNLILAPGFSTARKVSSVSGRGVGMDAVKRQIDALRGSLSFSSEEGKGTRILITLPLTLAIIEGLLLQIGNDRFIVPMVAVTENVELLRAQRARNNGRNVIAVRGELVPYIDLRQTFRMEGEAPAIEKVVIVRHEDNRVGLVVDRVLGTHQTVIQSLGKFFDNINVVSGATIMGDGRVALIMDIASMVRYADSQYREPPVGTC